MHNNFRFLKDVCMRLPVVIALVALLVLVIGGIVSMQWLAPKPVASLSDPAAVTPSTTPTEFASAPAPARPGATNAWSERIDVGGYELFITCAGQGSPLVVLEAGLDVGHSTWTTIQPAVAQFTRVCSYDRAGLEQSAPAPTPRTSQQVVADLHTLMGKASLPGPYVLVGHSFGGLHTRLYASEYPDEVVGMVLIDAIHPDWWARARALLPTAAPDESPRLQNFRKFLTEDVNDPSRNREGIDIEISTAQVRATGSLGDRPLVVLTAGIPNALAPGLPANLEAQLVRLMQQDLQAELAQLSSNSMHAVAPQSGHNIQNDQPDLVIQAIRSVVLAVRSQG